MKEQMVGFLVVNAKNVENAKRKHSDQSEPRPLLSAVPRL